MSGRRLPTLVSGAALLSALIFAPIFWGCTWPLGIAILDLLLGCAALAGLAGWTASPQPPPIFLLMALLFLLIQGWTMALNGRSFRDPATGELIALPHVPYLPNSVDAPASRLVMRHISALLGAGLLAAWLGKRPAWREAILWTMAATGAGLALLGFIQRWTHATDIFWSPSRHLDFFFATYRNVTNAGEYLNAVLPLAAALTLAEAHRNARPARLAAGAAMTLFILGGAMLCGSKIAPIVAMTGVAAFLVLQRAALRSRNWRAGAASRIVLGFVLVLVVGAVLWGAGLDTLQDRISRLWGGTDSTATFSNRWLVDQVCFLALPDAGWLGFGPGTFQAIFPYYSRGVPGNLAGVWIFAHDDYAQTVVEWGGLGAVAWGWVFFGGLSRAWRAKGKMPGAQREAILAGALVQAQMATALVAVADFPFQIASIQLVMAVITGLAWSAPGWQLGGNRLA